MDSSTPNVKEAAFGDLERELAVTRTVLERLPDEHFAWKPHVKSMSLAQLASHVAELPEWARVTIAADELDVSAAPQPVEPKNRIALLERFDRNATALRAAVANFDVANLNRPWTMRSGAEVLVTRPRAFVYRVWCVNHLIHHRGQLCLYLRLLNIPVPTVYFNSADDPTWVFA